MGPEGAEKSELKGPGVRHGDYQDPSLRQPFSCSPEGFAWIGQVLEHVPKSDHFKGLGVFDKGRRIRRLSGLDADGVAKKLAASGVHFNRIHIEPCVFREKREAAHCWSDFQKATCAYESLNYLQLESLAFSTCRQFLPRAGYRVVVGRVEPPKIGWRLGYLERAAVTAYAIRK